MKYLAIILLCLTGVVGVAQEKKSIQPVKSIAVEKDLEGKTLHTENKGIYISSKPIVKHDKTVEYYDDYIKSLEIKVEIVKGNSEEKERAEKSGWFAEMADNIRVAKEERDILVKQ